MDLKCWIEEASNGKKRILHEHYIKNVSNKQVIHRQAAMSINNKRTILTQQCLRIILNCSEELEEETKNKHMGFFMARMQASGYDHQFRLEVLKSAKHAFKNMKSDLLQKSQTFNDERLRITTYTWLQTMHDEIFFFTNDA